MNKWLKYLLYGFGGLLAVAILASILIVVLLPGDYHVSRSIVINAPADQVFPHVNTLKKWPEWSAWNTEKYPNLKYSHDGPDSGEGATQSWTEPEMGNGKLMISESIPSKKIAFRLEFEGMPHPMLGDFTFDEKDGKTTVTWSGEGELGMDPMSRVFGTMMDSMIGADYETGLANLKKRVETAAANPQGD